MVDREPDPGDDLQAPEVVGPPHARIDDQLAGPRRSSPRQFHHEIDRGTRQPDDAPAGVVNGRVDLGRDRGAGIPVRDDAGADQRADGQVHLPRRVPGVPGRQEDRKPRGERDSPSAPEARQLVAIVDRHVAHSPLDGHREAELMALTPQGPLLRERVGSDPARAQQRTDVLHDARLLVVGLFDEETVVLDGRWRCVLSRNSRREAGHEDEQGVPAKRHHCATKTPVPYIRTKPAATPMAFSGVHTFPVSRPTTP